MTGFTHGAVGAFIGKFLPLPIALPVALASHFVLDMLPHYGIPHTRRNDRFWKVFTTLDFLLAWGYLGYLLVSRRDFAMLVCGIVAASPDFIWVARIIRTRSFDLSKNASWFTKWHAGIQRFERPWGIFVELPIVATLGYLAYRTW
jgi:hypothetical protein